MREIFLQNGAFRRPFSKGLVVESLLNAGVEADTGAAIARSVEQDLLDHGQTLIAPEELWDLVSGRAGQLYGDGLAGQLRAQVPTFSDIIILDEPTPRPFSKGILARSLENTGLPSREAYQLAKEVDRALRLGGERTVSRRALEAQVERILERQLGEVARRAYHERADRIGLLVVEEERSGFSFPFSKGILAQSLLSCGLSPTLAHKLARETESVLLDRGVRVLPRPELRAVVADLLRKEVGEEPAQRYLLLRAIRRPPKPLVILIGGVSGTGKSHLASEIAYRLGINRVVSSDSVRAVMRKMVSAELLPALHASTFEAWQALLAPGEQCDRPSADLLLRGFREQVQQVSVGLQANIDRSVEERASLLLEGVHIVPGPLTRPREDAIVVPLLVVVPDAEQHRNHFYARERDTGHQRSKERYLGYFREIRTLQDYLQDQAATFEVAVIDGEALDRAADQATEEVTRRVLMALQPSLE